VLLPTLPEEEQVQRRKLFQPLMQRQSPESRVD
jgi:hypothetical protein